jgi:pilus assembly protein FimV
LADLADNPLVMPGAGVLVALLAGLGLYRLRRGRKPAGETSFLESRLQPDSFFGASGGQRVDTREGGSSTTGNSSSSMSYSLSQLDAIGDVDPVAEADVYLAYGRDLQAEEILKEAMRSTPERMAIRTKLLEVYAKRRDVKGYELLATQLFNLTRGEGEDWAKAQTMGLSIDPDNVLYQPGGQPDEVLDGRGQPVEPLGASTVPYTAPVAPPTFQPAPDAKLDLDDGIDLDLDLAGSTPAKPEPPTAAVESTQAIPTRADISGQDEGLDFDLSAVEHRAVANTRPGDLTPPASASSDGGLDFDISGFSLGPEPAAEIPKTISMPPKGPPAAEPMLDFGDFGLEPPAPPRGAEPAGIESRLDSNFDSGFGDSQPRDSQFGDGGDPLARKLELAEEFRQIGDLEGARDLLEEVVSKAEGTLKSKAQGMLDSL